MSYYTSNDRSIMSSKLDNSVEVIREDDIAMREYMKEKAESSVFAKKSVPAAEVFE